MVEYLSAGLLKREPEVRSGDLSAIWYALNLCWAIGNESHSHLDAYEVPVSLPGWLYCALLDLVDEQIDSIKGPGRTGNSRAQLKQHRIHLVRWGTVKHLRENCREQARTWPHAYAEASRELRGTVAQGSAGSMEASYKRHCRSLRGWDKGEMARMAREYYEKRDALLRLPPRKRRTDPVG